MKILVSLVAGLTAALAFGSAWAQSYPQKPVRVLVGFTPGGGTDINARLLAPKLAEYLGQQFVVENRPGAATNLATEVVAKSPGDGYTLLFTTSALAINASLYKGLRYDAVRDLAPVSVLCQSPNLLVAGPGTAAKSVAELIAEARAKPGALNYSSAGSGTSQHLAGELFKLRSGINVVHVPFKGTDPSLTAVVAGDVQFSFANIPAIMAKGGRLRPLAVAGNERSALMPDVPTMKETGVDGVEVPVWYALLAPASTPRGIVQALAAAAIRAARSPDLSKRILDKGEEPVGNTPEEFEKMLRADVARFAEVVRLSGAKAE
jgi:tripartite-type tricarboxylate transporter receptor subunit TctC